MYFKQEDSEQEVTMETSHVLLLALTTIFTLALGIVPKYVIEIFS
jgi:NADH:ubiquinone oxidoreductase subunit 2 (subunit N)